MRNVVITGYGLVTPFTNCVDDFNGQNIDNFQFLSLESLSNVSSCNRLFRSKKLISREDRVLLSKDAKYAVDVSVEAFALAEQAKSFTSEEKKEFPIFITNESTPVSFDIYEEFIDKFCYKNNIFDQSLFWSGVGQVKKIFHPLEMLRVLTTNSLYHVSKVLGLHGGGYTVRRMSLGSISALEQSLHHLQRTEKRALVVGVGDLTVAENYAAFLKMGLINDNNNTVIPSFGAASIILEKYSEDVKEARKCYAEVIECRSVFKSTSNIIKEDWLKIFDYLKYQKLEDLTILSYNSGNTYLKEQEDRALYERFPNARVLNYKAYIGYTGRANNLIDIVLSLFDSRIPAGSHILVNGIGLNSGLGYALLKKLC